MKKVLIVSNFSPFTYAGGVEVAMKNVVSALKGKVELVIVCQGKEASTSIVDGVTVKQVAMFPVFVASDIWYAFQVKRFTEQLNPDLVIDNGCLSFLNNTSKYKTVTVAHGTNYGNFLSRRVSSIGGFIKKLYRWLWAQVQKYFFRKAALIVAVSEKVKDEIVTYNHVESGKVVAIHNGTWLQLTQDEQQRVVSKPLQKKVLFVSTDHERKGIAVVEQVARLLPDCTFLVCGKPYTPALSNMEYLGLLNHEQLKQVMLECDCFLFPSYYEGQSLSLLDALAAGLPIVVSKAADPGIIIEGVHGFIIDGFNTDEYAQKVEKIFADTALLARMKAATMQLMHNYTWEKQGTRYQELVNQIL